MSQLITSINSKSLMTEMIILI